MDTQTIQKNILDLKYNKILQYFNTVIITTFTYNLSILIGVFTKQIQLNTLENIFPILLISILLGIICICVIVHLQNRLKEIEKEIRNLA